MSLSNEVPKLESEGRKLSIVNGKFALRVEEGTEGALPRNLTKGENEGKEVFELLYPTLEGILTSGEIRDLPFGPSPEVTITDGDEVYTAQFSWDSKHFAALASHLPNIDRSIPVSLSLVEHKTKRTAKGNPVIMLWVTQNGKRVDDYYGKWAKDEAGKRFATKLHGLPEVTQGRSGWDFKPQQEFYLDHFESYFAGEASTERADAPIPESANDEPPVDDGGELLDEEPDMDAPLDDDSGLPF